MTLERSKKKLRSFATRRDELSGHDAAGDRERDHGPGGLFKRGNKAGAGRRWKMAVRALLASAEDVILYRAIVAHLPTLTPLAAIEAALLVNEARSASNSARAGNVDAARASSELVMRHGTAMLDFAGLGPKRDAAVKKAASKVDRIKAEIDAQLAKKETGDAQ